MKIVAVVGGSPGECFAKGSEVWIPGGAREVVEEKIRRMSRWILGPPKAATVVAEGLGALE